MSGPLTHLDELGQARMVDVGEKKPTRRTAVARAEVRLSPGTLQAVVGGNIPKGDVLAVARIAGITGGKRTSDLIPLTHPVGLDYLYLDLTPDGTLPGIRIEATASTHGKTGVEMEALTAVSISALAIYDMLKSMERGIRITDIRLVFKDGGKSGRYEAD
ncbi:MAG TPA: cyclic pyranopterin monophosphate synthase MoaC [Proteobacteria bacterium]|nr:cyclic pyranopterin monophosphate synthase accessory protein 2 [bacterium BMS3Abin14]HDL52908.1 cyclic pyranopterin monophosphate synthase MoaC [Pseudomonadota bacterium]